MVKRVVVVGGGFAGSNVVCGLEKDERFSVTLIDTKDYFEFTPGVLRVLVEPEHIASLYFDSSSNVSFIPSINNKARPA